MTSESQPASYVRGPRLDLNARNQDIQRRRIAIYIVGLKYLAVIDHDAAARIGWHTVGTASDLVRRISGTLSARAERVALKLVDSRTHVAQCLAKPHLFLPGNSVLGHRNSSHDQNGKHA